MRTSFELSFDGQELFGQDGRALGDVTQDALYEAKRIVKNNPNLWFEIRRRSLEAEEIKLARQMARGELPNTMIIPSDFPAELEDSKEDIGGYNITRKQTMLRVLALKPDGNIQLYSQSLDGSDRTSLEAIYAHFGQMPEPGELLGQRIHVDLSPDEQVDLVDRLTGIYDRSMSSNYGGEWYAGRRPADYRNTYDFVCKQNDLVSECVRLRLSNELTDRRMYDLAATMQKRFKAKKQIAGSSWAYSVPISSELLHHEIKVAGTEARERGDTFSSCGGTLKSEDFDQSTENQLELSGYGNKSSEDDDCVYISKKCPECGIKNVRTTVSKIKGTNKKNISGSCGCSITVTIKNVV